MTKAITLTIDGKSCAVPEGTTVFAAAKQLGIEIPHFCYHPKLSIAGNCRLCQVEVAGAKGPIISCRERVREGMVVSVNSEKARDVRRDVLEFILINHPLDCPVCDQSGECKLQDQYFNHSLAPTQMQLPKVRKPKAKPIGPQVMLDAERCVLCTRCIRFCDEVVGEHQLLLRERGDHSTIDVAPGKQLDNAYSLCTVDICPVGALTSSDFRFKKRVWFLKSTPSLCTGCATGCNIWLDHSDGIAYRYRPRDNEAVNQCWLCDAGRMTYKDINSTERLLFPHVAEYSELKRVPWEAALARAASRFAGIASTDIVGVLSAAWSLEENLAFARFFFELGIKKLVWSGRAPTPAFADKILRDADRNPNSQGVTLITTEQFGTGIIGKGFFILGGLEKNDLLTLMALKPQAICLITDHLPALERWADVVLPRASHAEQEGLFVNRARRVQRAFPAFPPRGESLPGWQIATRLAEYFGKKVPYTSAAEVFAAEQVNYPVLAGVAYRAIPQEGIVL